MDNYQVLALDGAVLVGTTPCLRMNVYKKDEKTGPMRSPVSIFSPIQDVSFTGSVLTAKLRRFYRKKKSKKNSKNAYLFFHSADI